MEYVRLIVVFRHNLLYPSPVLSRHYEISDNYDYIGVRTKINTLFGNTKSSFYLELNGDSLLSGIQESYNYLNLDFGSNIGLLFSTSPPPIGYTNSSTLIGTIINGDTTGTIYNFPDDLGFEEKSIQSQLSFYPNPANNEITINIELNAIAIYNNLGQLVLDQNYPKQIIDVSSLPQGLYFIKGVDIKNKTLTSKLIIK